MSQILTPNELNGLLIHKNLMECKITDLKNELNNYMNTLETINIILEKYFNSIENDKINDTN